MKILKESSWTIKSLAKKLDSLDIQGQWVLRKTPKGLEIEFNHYGALDEHEYKKDVEKFQKLVGGWDGYQTGYGSWIYSETYKSDSKDFGDKSSSAHY